jgi:hypothetical protein
MTRTVEQHRDKLESHAEKDLPTADLAEALLEITDSDS